MHVYISCDIEGVAGITHWDEARKNHQDYDEYRRQMTCEAGAACEGALAAGASAITVKDAHGSGRNIIARELPSPARLIRGWSGHPYLMIQEIDQSYDAAVFIGYHGSAGAGGNPLSHTISARMLHAIHLNGAPCSEYRIHAYAAALEGVPVVFVSGDQTLCGEVAALQSGTRTFATKSGEGASQLSVHPDDAIEVIRNGVRIALSDDPSTALVELPDEFLLEITYKEHTDAYGKSFYPEAKLSSPHTVQFASDDYFEILRALMFLI